MNGRHAVRRNSDVNRFPVGKSADETRPYGLRRTTKPLVDSLVEWPQRARSAVIHYQLHFRPTTKMFSWPCPTSRFRRTQRFSRFQHTGGSLRLLVACTVSSVVRPACRSLVPFRQWFVPLAGRSSSLPVARPVHNWLCGLTDGECTWISVSHRSLTTTLIGSFGRIVIPAPRSIDGEETSSS